MAYGVEVTEGVLPKRTNPANSSPLGGGTDGETLNALLFKLVAHVPVAGFAGGEV